VLAGAAFAGTQLLLLAVRFLQLIASDSIELRGTARLLSTTLKPVFIGRAVLLAVGGVVLPLVATGAPALWAALALVLGGELAGRYLFFASVVPKHMAAPYLETGSEAA
jgi:DMSO reductase anchor subunit